MRLEHIKMWLLCALCLGVAGTTMAATVPEPEQARIPLAGAGLFGSTLDMPALVYLPAGQGPFPVLIFSHGRAGTGEERHQLQHPLGRSQLEYWLDKGFAVVAAIRPGYGNTGGGDPEYHASHFSLPGQCEGHPDYVTVAAAGSKAVLATIDWVRQQAWAANQPIVLEGQSVGGMLTVAVAATHPSGVIGYINFAGGAGGNPERSPGQSCQPEKLTELYAALGRQTTLPNVWIYAENDQYWGPDEPPAWHQAFAAGGSPTRFVHAPPVADGNGHGLSRHDSSLWAGYLDTFLQSLGAALPARH